ncbi:MAG: sugar transferase [Bacillota bacterium]
MLAIFFKRFIDIFGSVILLLLSLPVIILITIIIRVSMGPQIFYRQIRPGLHGKPFVIYKFRTMKDIKDDQGISLPDDSRITSLGYFLRNTSLDELPELINVLKGNISLVGPRPLLMEYLERYTPEQVRRHDVKPGITGWAQINGRNNLSWEDKFNLDVWYVDNWSLWLDIKILCLTIFKVVKRENINASGYATMPEFKGYRGA